MIELDALFAMHHSDAWAAARLPGCIAARKATPSHRVEAATLLLKSADMAGRDELREIAICGISSADLDVVNAPVRLEFQMLAASTQGDAFGAAAIGRDLIQIFRAEDEAAASTPIRYYQTALIALHLAGFEEEAGAEYERLFGVAELRGSYRARQFAAVQLFSLHWDAGREHQANMWLKRALAISRERPELANDFDLATARIESAIYSGRFDEARGLLGGRAGIVIQANEPGRRWSDAAVLAIESASGRLAVDARDRLLEVGRRRFKSMTGARDFEMAVCVEALHRLGLRHDATQLLHEYFENERRTPRPMSRLLARATELLSR
jgi:hypothetical protein